MRFHHKVYIIGSLFLLAFLSSGLVATARDSKGRFVVVIDAGHGGKDSGAIGKQSKEKDIVLSVALKVGKRVKALNNDITVCYTRQDDRFVGLQQRAELANKKKADLFVSIHANSHKSGTPSGAETYVLGLHRTQDNLEVAMKENAAILFEKDHNITYQGFDPSQSESYIVFNFIQNKHLSSSIDFANFVQKGLVLAGQGNRGVKQAGFLVLREVAMPSVLVELGFISNRNDERFMLSESGSQALANHIAKAIVEYEAKLSGRSNTKVAVGGAGATEVSKEQTSNAPEVSRSDTIYYRVQVMADTRRLEPGYFGKYSGVVGRTKEGKYYKYTLYNTTSLEEAKRYRKELRVKYKDCFIVGFDSRNNKVRSYY